MSSRIKYASIDAYFKSRICSIKRLGNNSDLRPIAEATGLSISEVRAALPRCGYEQITNRHGIHEWRLKK